MSELIAIERIENRILLIRDQKVMLDSDLAEMYGVTTKRLNEQVKRNIKRFPPDFMFQLTIEEADLLRSHFATSRDAHGKLHQLEKKYDVQFKSVFEAIWKLMEIEYLLAK